MWRCSIILLFAALSAAGCSTCGTKTGWRFEVLRPPTVASESLVQSGPAPLGVVGLCNGGMRSDLALASSLFGATAGPAPAVALEQNAELVWTIRTILQRLDSLERQSAPPMPPSKSAPSCSK